MSWIEEGWHVASHRGGIKELADKKELEHHGLPESPCREPGQWSHITILLREHRPSRVAGMTSNTCPIGLILVEPITALASRAKIDRWRLCFTDPIRKFIIRTSFTSFLMKREAKRLKLLYFKVLCKIAEMTIFCWETGSIFETRN